jgi:predicted RecA/RadA family phage recombinase
VTQWNSLRNDLLKSRQHQSGVDESGNLGLPTLDIRLSDADRAAYLSMATLINNNKNITPPSGEASFVTLITSNRSSGWNGTVNQTLTIEFGTANNLRWFFNSGGNFQVSSTLTNFATTGDSKLVNESWDVLLRNMGIIKLSNLTTSNTGTGTPATNIGFANLTSTNQLIFSKLVEAGNQYTPNQYDLYARISGGSALVLTPTWSYTDAGNDGIWRVFEPVIGTLNSICQMYIASGANVAVAYPQVTFSGTGWTHSSAYSVPPPSYSIRPNVTLVNEGSTVTYTVSTDNVINGTVLYWKNLGSSTASDFTDDANSGSVTITADVGTITRQVRADTTTEFVNETIILKLLTGSINGDVVSTADTVTISDTSLTPVSYSITPNVLSQDEGLPVIFTITTTGVPTGTVLYWINVGTTNSTDFPNSVNDGTVVISNGTGSITRSATADLTTEGPETLILELHSDSVNGPLLVTSSTVTINDASTTPLLPTYDVAPSVYSVNEGIGLIFYVTTSRVANGTVLYWTINNNTSTNADFSNNVGGTVTINSNAGQFTVTPTSDSTTEGPESFSVSLRSTSVTGQIIATSPTVTIGDTSQTPPPPPPPDPPAPTPTLAAGAVGPYYNYTIPVTPFQTKAYYIQIFKDNNGPATQSWSVSTGLSIQSGFGQGNSGTFSGDINNAIVGFNGPHDAGYVYVTVSASGYNSYSTSIYVPANATYTPYTLSNGFAQEFGASQSVAASVISFYTGNGTFTVSDGSTRYQLYRRPESTGVAYWTNFLVSNGLTTSSQQFLDAFGGAPETQTGPKTSFGYGSGYNVFSDKP